MNVYSFFVSLGICGAVFEDMVKVNGEWQPCVPRTVHRTCDLDEFRTYLMDFDVRLSNVFQMLGEEMEMVDLTDLKILTAPIPGGCENFAFFWQRFLNGLCFVSLPGLRTITMSFLVASGVALSGGRLEQVLAHLSALCHGLNMGDLLKLWQP